MSRTSLTKKTASKAVGKSASKATKKKPPAAAVRASSPASPSAAKRSAEAALRAVLSAYEPKHRRLVSAMRRALRDRLPTAHEVAYEYRDACVVSYSPSDRGYEGVLAIRVSADGVQLYFQTGKGLPDPKRVLQGSGRQARWVAVGTTRDLERPEVAGLIEAAIRRSRVPFATGGVPALEVRTTTETRRRLARST